MKKIIFVSVVLCLLSISLSFAGGQKEAVEPADKFLQPNTLWGIGIKPDGTPYKFLHVAPFMGHEFMVTVDGAMRTICERAGAKYSTIDAAANLENQQAALEDALVSKPDGIFISVIDAPSFAIYMEKAARTGIPIFEYDHCTFHEKVTSSVTHDQVRMGEVAGQWFLDYQKKTGKELHIYEVWAMYSQEGVQKRHRGIRNILDGKPNITILESPDTKSRSEIAQDAVLDAFSTHPELNAIVAHYNMTIGITESLRTLGKLYPIGDPRHIPIITMDEVPSVLDHMREGLDVPKEIIMDTYMVTVENMDQSRWGAPAIWGDMLRQEPNFNKWPILDCPYIETPKAK
jgi:ABC-type sugar transport system substrate-binding protein